MAFVDQVYPGDDPDGDAAGYEIHLVVVKLPQARLGFVLLPMRWLVGRTFSGMAGFRRLAWAYERHAETQEGPHCVALQLPDASQGRPSVLPEFMRHSILPEKESEP